MKHISIKIYNMNPSYKSESSKLELLMIWIPSRPNSIIAISLTQTPTSKSDFDKITMLVFIQFWPIFKSKFNLFLSIFDRKRRKEFCRPHLHNFEDNFFLPLFLSDLFYCTLLSSWMQVIDIIFWHFLPLRS